VSLLLSKENPTVASLTIRNELQQLVGLGKLGSQKHAETALTREKRRELISLTDGWDVLAMEETKESITATEVVLRKEVDKEANYWEGVLSIREHGWSMCRLPRERQTLGVRFGFNEASPEFRDLGLAPMRHNKDDGSVELDLGVLGGQAQRVVVTLERGGQVVGRSSFDGADLDGAGTALSVHVLEARNTIFARELWHELQIESRSLLAYDVRHYQGSIVYTGKHGFAIKLELLSPSTCPPLDEVLPETPLAESIQITLSLLLEHHHRQQETIRSRPAPLSQPRSKAPLPCYLLRPIIARIIQLDAIDECTRYVGAMVESLNNSKLPDSKFELVTTPLPASDAVKAISHQPGAGATTASSILFQSILQPPRFAIDLTILPGQRMSIIGLTYLTPATTTLYHINLMASPQSDIPNTLSETCPPYRDYPSFRDLRDYINRAVACAVTSHAHRTLDQLERTMQDNVPATVDEEDLERQLWQRSVIGTSLFTATPQKRNVRFEVEVYNDTPQLAVLTRVSPPDGSPKATVVSHVWKADGTGADERGVVLPNVLTELVRRAYR
jgi:mediator of RNA polymerase II transcription subunit 17, fungi type